jgi:hypothetical protein
LRLYLLQHQQLSQKNGQQVIVGHHLEKACAGNPKLCANGLFPPGYTHLTTLPALRMAGNKADGDNYLALFPLCDNFMMDRKSGMIQTRVTAIAVATSA